MATMRAHGGKVTIKTKLDSRSKVRSDCFRYQWRRSVRKHLWNEGSDDERRPKHALIFNVPEVQAVISHRFCSSTLQRINGDRSVKSFQIARLTGLRAYFDKSKITYALYPISAS